MGEVIEFPLEEKGLSLNSKEGADPSLETESLFQLEGTIDPTEFTASEISNLVVGKFGDINADWLKTHYSTEMNQLDGFLGDWKDAIKQGIYYNISELLKGKIANSQKEAFLSKKFGGDQFLALEQFSRKSLAEGFDWDVDVFKAQLEASYAKSKDDWTFAVKGEVDPKGANVLFNVTKPF